VRGKDVPEWRVEPGLTDYADAVAAMEARAAAIRSGTADERIWLVEHPPVYTGGTSATAAELLAPGRFPVFATGRGGRYTYHGPGQRVVYVMLDLDRRGRDLRGFITTLESWVIAALGDFGIAGRSIAGRVGVWTDTPAGEAKIAAIGVRVRRWVSYHGLAINVAPDLEHFAGIVPCGLAGYPVTSLAALGVAEDMAAVDAALRRHSPFG
jgi:lipoyl(octanoyl) transferase